MTPQQDLNLNEGWFHSLSYSVKQELHVKKWSGSQTGMACERRDLEPFIHNLSSLFCNIQGSSLADEELSQ